MKYSPLFPSLAGFASYSPATRLTNFDLELRVDTSDAWIVERTGIRERRIMEDGVVASDLATEAAKEAIRQAGLAADDITHTVVATCTPDYLTPSSACIIAHHLGLRPGMAFDLNAGCTGFIYALQVAEGLLYTQPDARILLIAVEGLSRRLNWADRSTCVLFGDGAAACVMTATPLPSAVSAGKLVDVLCTADGHEYELITMGGGTRKSYAIGDSLGPDFFLAMQGGAVYKNAVRNMVAVAGTLLERNNLTADDIDLFVPHQANLRIIEAVGSRLHVDPARVFTNVEKHGNTSAASIPIALDEAFRAGRIKPGARVLLAAFGSGLTWGAAILEF